MEHLVVGRACWTSQRYGRRVWGALASPSAMSVSTTLHHNMHAWKRVLCCEKRADHVIVARCGSCFDNNVVIWVICAYALDSDNIYWNYIVYWTPTTYIYCIAYHASVSKQAAAAAASNHDRCNSGKQFTTIASTQYNTFACSDCTTGADNKPVDKRLYPCGYSQC